MTNPPNRRRVLRLAGTGVAASIAGCTNLDRRGNGDSDDPSASPVTAVAGLSPDAQQDISAQQQELQRGMITGDINQSEAQEIQAELRQQEAQLFEEAVADLESYLEEADELTIEDSLEDAGAYLVDGSSDALLEGLNAGSITQLLSAETFTLARDQRDGQPAMEGGSGDGQGGNVTNGTEPTENETGSGAEDDQPNESDGA